MLSEQQVKLDLFHVLYIGLKYAADSILNTLLILHKQLLSGISALDISTGPLHFSDRRTSSGQYILSFTGPYGPPRYISGHQISNSAGPNDDKSQYVLFARAPVSSLPFSRNPFATARRQRVASRSWACQSNTLTCV